MFLCFSFFFASTVVPATTGPLGEQPPALHQLQYCLCRVNVPVSGGHLPRGTTFAPNRRWPLVAGTTVIDNKIKKVTIFLQLHPNNYFVLDLVFIIPVENIIMLLPSFQILLVFVLIRVLSRHVSDRNLLVAGFLVITVAVCILMWFLTRPQTSKFTERT